MAVLTMSNSLIKDSLLPFNRSNQHKLLESRKAKSNLLKHTSSSPSLNSIANGSSGQRTSSSSKNLRSHSSNYSREKSLLSSWAAAAAAAASASGGDSGSDSSSSLVSTPSSGNVESLNKQIAALEVELKERTERLETANERLSDRDLEISILKKRLELKSSLKSSKSSNSNSHHHDKASCHGCTRKDGLISCLFEKVNLYESAFLGTDISSNASTPSVDVKSWDLDTILRNVGELNKLVAENERTVEYVGEKGAKFLPTNVMHLAFYADGIQLDEGRFRSYAEKATKAFMKDLSDGFFPSELQVTFPNGVIFMVDDRRTTHKRSSRTDDSSSKRAFQGVGHRLECSPLLPPLSPSSSSSSSRPISAPFGETKAKSPKKKPAMTKAASSKDLLHKNNHHRKSQKKALTSANAHSKASEKCFLKVHGIGDAPFLMELVAYDTIKTVRSLLGNVLKSEFIKQNRCSDSLPSATTSDFKLFTGFPRRVLNDDSKSLGDLGLVPNGVLHLVRSNMTSSAAPTLLL